MSKEGKHGLESESDSKESTHTVERPRRVNPLKNAQKQLLDTLMEDPDKPVEIPDKPKDWKPSDPPEFVRFYMGSSAGAGSEVFHVYRHLRRYEMSRQQWIDETAKAEDKDTAFLMRLADKKIEAEEKTAKKRAKRLRKKERQRQNKKSKTQPNDQDDIETTTAKDSEDEHEDEEGGIHESPFVIGGK